MSAVAVAELCEVNPRHPKGVQPSDMVAFVGMADLDDVTATAVESERRPFADVAKGFTPFMNGDILMAKITPCFENCKIGQAKTSTQVAAGSTEFHVMRPGSRLNARYLLHFLRQPWVRELGELRMTGSGGQRRVPERLLDELQIPLPPIEEQQRVAAVLDAADDLRTKRRQALAKLDTLTQAIFIDMFGDPARNSQNLPLAELGSLGTWKSGGTPARNRPDYFQGDIPWFSSGDLESEFLDLASESVSQRALDETSAKAVPPNALLLGMYDTAALKSGITTRTSSCNQAVAFAVLDESRILTRYAYTAIQIGKSHYKRNQRGIRQKNLNLSMIRSIRLPLPSITQQVLFESNLNRVDCSRSSARKALKQSELLFASLQQRAFKGNM